MSTKPCIFPGNVAKLAVAELKVPQRVFRFRISKPQTLSVMWNPARHLWTVFDQRQNPLPIIHCGANFREGVGLASCRPCIVSFQWQIDGMKRRIPRSRAKHQQGDWSLMNNIYVEGNEWREEETMSPSSGRVRIVASPLVLYLFFILQLFLSNTTDKIKWIRLNLFPSSWVYVHDSFFICGFDRFSLTLNSSLFINMETKQPEGYKFLLNMYSTANPAIRLCCAWTRLFTHKKKASNVIKHRNFFKHAIRDWSSTHSLTLTYSCRCQELVVVELFYSHYGKTNKQKKLRKDFLVKNARTETSFPPEVVCGIQMNFSIGRHYWKQGNSGPLAPSRGPSELLQHMTCAWRQLPPLDTLFGSVYFEEYWQNKKSNILFIQRKVITG